MQNEKIKREVKLRSPLGMAFLGDAVYELLVRRYVAKNIDASPSALHKMTVSAVCAEAQAKALALIVGVLSEDEKAIAIRGRNATKSAVPRSSNPRDYRHATALESLFGYLYLIEDHDRIEELFDIISASIPLDAEDMYI